MEQRDTAFEGSWSWHQGQWNATPPPSLPTVLNSHHLHEGNELWLDTSACGSGKDSRECSPRRKKGQKGYLDCFKKILPLLLCWLGQRVSLLVALSLPWCSFWPGLLWVSAPDHNALPQLGEAPPYKGPCCQCNHPLMTSQTNIWEIMLLQCGMDREGVTRLWRRGASLWQPLLLPSSPHSPLSQPLTSSRGFSPLNLTVEGNDPTMLHSFNRLLSWSEGWRGVKR